ncbi:hypothetical protein [Candidatus Phytoplasma fabacearum]|nr:hypothetical protein ['Bituminaria bituminosa' little leaf phytoplasma]MDO7983753.1 hypothetical protein ['Bituminaria bituminosa' little leaf phytoplasma]MDV3164520.1 hypothetical protein [Pigeon pea little leaf phytoplasma]MDV3189131.1 hypothetical protein [Pigeon pea little leaf phytoplasma]
MLSGQIFFIMNVLAHNEEIEEENEKLSQNHKQLLESYNKIQHNNKVNLETKTQQNNNNNININKHNYEPILKSLRESIELQKNFFKQKTNSLNISLKKLTDEAVQSVIVFKNNAEEKIDHIEYFNKFGELISKVFLNEDNTNLKQIEEYQNNQLLKKIIVADNSKSESVLFYKDNKIKTEILNVYDEKTKNFVKRHILEFNNEEQLIATSFYQLTDPYKIEKKIYWDKDNQQNPIKIENFKYVDGKLNIIEEFNKDQKISKITIMTPDQKISSIQKFNYLEHEILIETKSFDSNNKVIETNLDVIETTIDFNTNKRVFPKPNF